MALGIPLITRPMVTVCKDDMVSAEDVCVRKVRPCGLLGRVLAGVRGMAWRKEEIYVYSTYIYTYTYVFTHV